MKTFYLIIDESGAKGYSQNRENHSQEFGVMVGFLVPSEHIMAWRSEAEKYFPINTNEKVHITSLNPETQHNIRKTLYDIFLQNKKNWLYHAIFVEGFHEGTFSKESLHAKLFAGVFINSLYQLTCLKENGSIKIHVISDTLNEGEIKLFKNEVQDLMKILTNQEIERNLKIFDKNSNSLIETTSRTQIIEKDENFPSFENIQLEISTENTALTLMADILVNSVFFYLKEYVNNTNEYPALNTKQAIKEHPLSKFVLALQDENNKDALPNTHDLAYRKRTPLK